MTAIRPDRGMQLQRYAGFGNELPTPELTPLAQAVEHWLFQQGLLSNMPVDQPTGQGEPDIERIFNEMHQEERLQGGRPSEHQLGILNELGIPPTTGRDSDIQTAIAGMLGE